MAIARINTPLGVAQLEGDRTGLNKISITNEENIPAQEIPEELIQAVDQLLSYFKGEREGFELNLNPRGTEFQKRVWMALLKIPFGKTISYLELAKMLGDPKAVRAVAAANGKNPLWIIIPCHRVIGSNGSLTGYAGELWRKKWLLQHESESKQQSLF